MASMLSAGSAGPHEDWPLTVPRKPRYPSRGLAVPIPSFPRRCGSARPHLHVRAVGCKVSAGPRGRPALYSARCADSSSTFLALATLLVSCAGTTGAAPDKPVRILTGGPTTLDPAAQGDAGSAAITAQLFESLTSFDADLQVRPALAESWQFADGGQQVTFHLRPNLTFSDGSPLRAVRRRPQLAPDDRPGPSVALGVADPRRQGCRRVPARHVDRPGLGRAPRR